MDTKIITEIIDLMKESDLTEFEIEQRGLKLKIRRNSSGAMVVSAPEGVSQIQNAPAPAMVIAGAPAIVAEEEDIEYIKSPMVGTFYQSSSPDADPFIDVHGKVEKTTTVCIIEAMKVMNEIQAEIKGTILEILVNNGEPVEYGQPIFKIKTA